MARQPAAAAFGWTGIAGHLPIWDLHWHGKLPCRWSWRVLRIAVLFLTEAHLLMWSSCRIWPNGVFQGTIGPLFGLSKLYLEGKPRNRNSLEHCIPKMEHFTVPLPIQRGYRLPFSNTAFCPRDSFLFQARENPWRHRRTLPAQWQFQSGLSVSRSQF